MLSPVSGAAIDFAFKEEPGGIARVVKRHEQKVHGFDATSRGESEGRKQRDRLAALLEEGRAFVHGLEPREFLSRVAHDEPPEGTWL